MGGHNQDHTQRKTEVGEPSVCQNLSAMVQNHDHEQAHDFIYENLEKNPNQPDCFFYNARLYFHHKLSGREKHSKPTFDSLIVLYDSWFAASRNPNEVLNWKGRDIRDYYYKEPDSLRKYCAMYKRIYDADKENMHPFNLKMLAFCACDLNGKIDIDSLWHFTKKQAERHSEAPWKASYKSLKRELIGCPKVSCAQLHSLLHPVLASGKEGSEETHKLHQLMAHRGCTGYVKSTAPTSAIAPLKESEKKAPEPEKIPETPVKQIEEPTKAVIEPIKEEPVKLSGFELLMKNGEVSIQSSDFPSALKNYDEATRIASNLIEKSDALLGMATASEAMNDFVKAKEYAMQVHHMLPDEMDGMKFISKIYQRAEENCEFKTPKEKSGYYIILSTIAWNLSSAEESDAWKEKAELTELYRSGGAKKGEKVKVGCFINEEVELP